MSLPDLLGWIGNIFFVIGAILLTRKNRLGFYNNLLGNCFYVSQGIFLKVPSLWLLSVGLGIVNICGYYHWSKNEHRPN